MSSSLSRIHRPKATSTAEIRNATRQPQLRNCSSVRAAASTARTPLASRLPAGGPICAADAQKPRLFGSPYSLDSSTAPPHSPPTPTPWANRSSTRMIGARDPDGGVAGQQADQQGGDADQHQRADQDVLAADLVAEPAEDDAADRAGDEPDRVGGEGQQGAGERVLAGEEQLREHQGGGSRVDREVVVLQGGAGEAGRVGLDQRAAAGSAGSGGGCGHLVPPRWVRGGGQEAGAKRRRWPGRSCAARSMSSSRTTATTG